MRPRDFFQNTFLLSSFVSNSSAADCTPSFFQSLLPSNAKVAYARSLAANSTFEVPSGDIAYPTSPQGLPALCAVQINVTSSSSSAFSFGLFLPTEGKWNNRFLAVGNGGFAGGINWLDMAAGVGYGFATMSTDTGHNSTAGDITWAYKEPQRRLDFGWRAMHGSVVVAKTVVEGFYGSESKWNYYSGCSTGGRQGLKEVEMFPDDFDGVLAGAPAWWTTHLQTWTIKAGLYNLPETAEHHIPVSLFNTIGAEVLRQCDPQDGVKDNIIQDPNGCNFFPELLLCGANVTNGTAAGCLTTAQIGSLYQIYNDYVETNQTFIFPHLELGSEAQWPFLLGAPEPSTYGTEYPQYMLDLGSDWSYWNFNYSIIELADNVNPGNCNADDFDLSPFQSRGGKLLMYQGYSDALIPTGSSIYFYKEVLKTMHPKGIDLDPWFRHFLIPGMQHCSGTPPDMNAPWYFAGASQAGLLSTRPGSVHGVPGFEDSEHDALLALMAWTEHGKAPDHIVATKWRNDTLFNVVERQRPVCPFPKIAKYVGHGSVDEASSWTCEEEWTLMKVQ